MSSLLKIEMFTSDLLTAGTYRNSSLLASKNYFRLLLMVINKIKNCLKAIFCLLLFFNSLLLSVPYELFYCGYAATTAIVQCSYCCINAGHNDAYCSLQHIIFKAKIAAARFFRNCLLSISNLHCKLSLALFLDWPLRISQPPTQRKTLEGESHFFLRAASHLADRTDERETFPLFLQRLYGRRNQMTRWKLFYYTQAVRYQVWQVWVSHSEEIRLQFCVDIFANLLYRPTRGPMLSTSASMLIGLEQWRAEVWWCPLPNSSIEQWRKVVIVTGYTLQCSHF